MKCGTMVSRDMSDASPPSANLIKSCNRGHAAAVRQLPNGTNDDDLYIRIGRVGNTIKTVNSTL